AVGLRQYLPDADFGAGDRRQKLALLLFGSPANQHGRDDSGGWLKDVGQVEAVFEELGFEYHLVIDGETGAAVFLRINRKQPTLGSELLRKTAAKLVLLAVFTGRPGGRPPQVLRSAHVLAE